MDVKILGGVDLRQARRRNRAQGIADLVVDAAGGDEGIILDFENRCAPAQSVEGQGNGVEQPPGDVGDAVLLVMQGLAVDRLVYAQAQLSDTAERQQRGKAWHNESQCSQQVERGDQVAAPPGFGHVTVAGNDEVGIVVTALALTLGQGLEHVSGDPRVVLAGPIVHVGAWRPDPVVVEVAMLRGQPVCVRVVGEAFEGGVKAAEVEPLRAIGQPEMLLERLPSGRILALLADPVLHCDLGAELQQWCAVARDVEHGQVAVGIVHVQQVGRGVAVDAQRAQADPASWEQVGCSPDQLSGFIAEAAFGHLLVARGDEVEFAREAVAVEVIVPVVVERGLEGGVEIQRFDETLKIFSGYLNERRGVIALGFDPQEQAVEDIERRAVVVETRGRQGFDDAYWSVGEGSGPRVRKQRVEDIVLGLALPVAEQRLGQAQALGDRGQVTVWAISTVVQGHDVDLVRVEVVAMLGEPLLDRAPGFAIGAGNVAQVIADVLDARGVDTGGGHGVRLVCVEKRTRLSEWWGGVSVDS
ncbi:hypothetical protein D3C76_541010 [compost metagenome]